MGEIFIDMTKGVGIFLIAGQTILHFGVGKQYEKYIKLIISFMVAAQLISGFGSFFQKNEEEKGLSLLRRFQTGYYENWERNMEDFEEKLRERQMDLEQSMEKQQTDSEWEDNRQSQQGTIRIEEIRIGE